MPMRLIRSGTRITRPPSIVPPTPRGPTLTPRVRCRCDLLRVPPAPDAEALPLGQPGSASESASTAILRASTPTSNHEGLLRGRA